MVMLSFVACEKDVLNNTTDTTTNIHQVESSKHETEERTSLNNSSTPQTEPPTQEGGLPVYIPGSIKLGEREIPEFNFLRNYRSCYYAIDGYFLDLVDMSEFNKWAASVDGTDGSKELKEMLLVSFVKRFDISRDVFDKTIEEMKKGYTLAGVGDFNNEGNEIPNADIIYTFDNEIINEYYRYE